MGSEKNNSVIITTSAWDHPNLFLVGSGTFPTVTTGL